MSPQIDCINGIFFIAQTKTKSRYKDAEPITTDRPHRHHFKASWPKRLKQVHVCLLYHFCKLSLLQNRGYLDLSRQHIVLEKVTTIRTCTCHSMEICLRAHAYPIGCPQSSHRLQALR